MKKFLLLSFGVILLAGCSSNKEKELCETIDNIDVLSYTESENYEELTTLLESEYDKYCNDSDSSICEKLEEYIDVTEDDIELENCNNATHKELCEADNKLKISSKKTNVNYMHEEFWAICNE